MLLVPLHHADLFVGSSPDRLQRSGRRINADTLDIAPASGRLHGVPILHVPVDEVIPPGEAVRVPWQEVSWQVYSPGKPRESRLGQKLWFQLELVHYRLSLRFAQELTENEEENGIPWWTGTIKTNIFDFDIPPSPPVEKCVNKFRID